MHFKKHYLLAFCDKTMAPMRVVFCFQLNSSIDFSLGLVLNSVWETSPYSTAMILIYKGRLKSDSKSKC